MVELPQGEKCMIVAAGVARERLRCYDRNCQARLGIFHSFQGRDRVALNALRWGKERVRRVGISAKESRVLIWRNLFGFFDAKSSLCIGNLDI